MSETPLTVTEGPGPVELARTLLFVPGSRPERFAKAASTPADLVVLDLEDGVAADGKAGAREAVTAWLRGGGRAVVRLNAAGTAHHEADLAALAGVPGLLGVVVPMADDPAVLVAVGERLGAGVAVVAQVETALGVMRALDLAGAPGVRRIAFGHLDFAADIDAAADHDALLVARSTLVLASRAAGLPGPVDSVTTDLDDPGAARADAERARRLGFAGKLCIHPRQVDGVNAAFTPSEEEVAWARRVADAASSGGAVRVDGHMVDAPVLLKAQAILARAEESS